jgi:hypothetical protein
MHLTIGRVRTVGATNFRLSSAKLPRPDGDRQAPQSAARLAAFHRWVGLEIVSHPARVAAAARPIQTPITAASVILAARETVHEGGR